jgi:hypothetical protein
MEPFDLIYQTDGLPSQDLPPQLGRLYGGDLGFKSPRLYANFVSSLDGVVAIEGVDHSSQMISGNSRPDRFVMGLLRAFADAVLIGAATMRAAPDSLWTPGYIFPDCATDFSELRDRLGRDADVIRRPRPTTPGAGSGGPRRHHRGRLGEARNATASIVEGRADRRR